ncbi:MAG: hypothetical protein E7359_04200 [Clostridiales bacterium]|nr:hypothetical protein [Clostridiales bacterium]
MKNKVVALMLLIPLLLIFTTFSLANVSSLYVPVSVSSITSLNKNVEYIELTENNTLNIQNQILPLKAENQEVTYSKSSVGNYSMPNINISNDGIITAFTPGTCKITTTTNDGGYVSSFILEVNSKLPLDFVITSNNEVKINETLYLTANLIPSNSTGTIKWYSSNNNIAKVEELTGKLTPIQSGEVTVTAILNNGLNGQIVKTQKITILKGDVIATMNGSTESSIKTYSGKVDFVASVDLDKVNEEDINFNYDEEKFLKFNIVNQLGVNTANFIIDAELNPFYSSATIELRSKETVLSTLTIIITDDLESDSCSFVGLNDYLQINAKNDFTVSFEPEDLEGVNVEIIVENNDVLALLTDGLNFQIEALKVGTNIVTAKFYVNDNFVCEIYKTVTVLAPYTGLNFEENSQTFGLVSDEIFVFGKYKIENNDYVLDEYTLKLTATEEIDLNKIDIYSSDSNIATVSGNKLKVVSNGIVTIYAESKDAKLLNLQQTPASFTLKVIDGVNVSTYDDIVKATEESKVVVLQNKINLGVEVLIKNGNNTSLISNAKSILQSEVKQIDTTADYTYYTNIGKERPTINYILEFKNDVYGNGYSLNADNITNVIDSYGFPYNDAVFKGPLDYVSLQNIASVKAQDNIVYLVRNDNVKINNIELKGCDDVDDLTKLNYTGTTLEIMGDNVTLFNSRVQNGRNVVRIFGDYEDSNKQITVNIENCILRNAREFILKIGTNKYILGDITGASDEYSAASPSLGGYTARNDNNLDDLTFMENYVKTIVNLKNSVLTNSGLFAIGMECKFAGPCLDGKQYNSYKFSELGWYNLAGTSYPAVLNLIGDVRIYDFKDIELIDSSTLIEVSANINNFPINFNIAEMITSLNTQQEYNGIIVDYNNHTYAHGGIVYYGGGKNYSIVNLEDFTGEKFTNYSIMFDDLNNTTRSDLLKLAAGKEPFRFLMYNSTSDFSVQKQIDDLHSGIAFRYIRNLNK